MIWLTILTYSSQHLYSISAQEIFSLTDSFDCSYGSQVTETGYIILLEHILSDMKINKLTLSVDFEPLVDRFRDRHVRHFLELKHQ